MTDYERGLDAGFKSGYEIGFEEAKSLAVEMSRKYFEGLLYLCSSARLEHDYCSFCETIKHNLKNLPGLLSGIQDFKEEKDLQQ